MPSPACDRVGSDGLGLLLTAGPGDVDRWGDAGSTFAMLEADGCSTLWLPDHLFWGHDIAEPFVMAAAAAVATSTCRIGIGVLQLPLRHPSAVAKAATTLQFLAGGRFVLGLGSGEHELEYDRAGIDFTRRGALLDEGIDELQACWAEPEGWYGQRPVPDRIPLWVGGASPAALSRAARVAAGWMPIFETPAQFARDNATLDGLLADLHRAPGDVERAVLALVSVTGGSWTRQDGLDWVGTLYRIDPGKVDRYLISGSAEECADQLRVYGADHVTVLPATDNPIDMYRDLNRAFVDGLP